MKQQTYIVHVDTPIIYRNQFIKNLSINENLHTELFPILETEFLNSCKYLFQGR